MAMATQRKKAAKPPAPIEPPAPPGPDPALDIEQKRRQLAIAIGGNLTRLIYQALPQIEPSVIARKQRAGFDVKVRLFIAPDGEMTCAIAFVEEHSAPAEHYRLDHQDGAIMLVKLEE